MDSKKKPTGVGEDVAHRPMLISEDELAENWKRTFGSYYEEGEDASPKTRVEKKNRKSSSVSNEKMG